MFQVEALADAAQLDVEVAADELQRHFFAGVAGGIVDFAEAALADASLDGVAGQGACAGGKQVPHWRRRSGWRRARRRVGPFRHRVVAVWFHNCRLFWHS